MMAGILGAVLAGLANSGVPFSNMGMVKLCIGRGRQLGFVVREQQTTAK